VNQEIAQRRACARVLGAQMIHFDVAFVAQGEPRRAVEHAQPLRHVVERGSQQSRLHAAAAVHEQAGCRRRAKREGQRHDDSPDRVGSLGQRFDNPIGAADDEK